MYLHHVKTLLYDSDYLNRIVSEILLESDFYMYDKIESFKDGKMYLGSDSVSLYSKHGFTWIKIRYKLYVDINDMFINYAFHGYINNANQIVQREVLSLYPKVIAEGIATKLNSKNLGDIIRELVK